MPIWTGANLSSRLPYKTSKLWKKIAVVGFQVLMLLLILNKNLVWCIRFLAGIAMPCMLVKQDVALKTEIEKMLKSKNENMLTGKMA